MVPWWLLAIAVFGANFALWGMIGLLRLLDGWRTRRSTVVGLDRFDRALGVDDVAVLIPAHNEEAVIADSLAAITALVPPENVHVVSDGSTDRTVELARDCGVQVISTARNVGKAGALKEAIRRFDLVERFPVVMLLDADTHVQPGYFAAALPLFDDPEVVAVAGCVRTNWRGRGLGPVGKLVALHRQRIYTMTQYLLKFGQTWRRTNATHIVPGFASMYRTEVLPRIEVNPPGLVIEDFNMTFEVYQKRLGKVGFTPSAVAATQDPGCLKDYVKQCKRWALGLWQTVRLHPPRANLFTAMLALLLLEMLTSSLLLVVLPIVVVVLLLAELLPALPQVPVFGEAHQFVSGFATPSALLFGVLVPDLLLTCVVALLHRQPRYLLVGLLFLPLRVLDAAIALYAIPGAWLTKSSGRWRSPGRRTTAPSPPAPTG
ncbi:Glycosyltransferase, catalytic subunit of cellulose synthase and poly-beta-1,6-N-acetylglucosamine synthase [Saccharopolyspora kobensis]|uniref:Glycosyltransferase, catalytic subunit of cellulose synthase and poly-beta-1,6-N-acetylglucosamine synthase n=1 Tax=Saccharopolyspora kobensis TaxID=146035 RepID=A0A1H5U4Y2_9PSEU|nr:glycosyltransferase family 2 protein [Saccharopolyspora kobensis]SEF69458.1 Glycosyltransferase, catalytic subunit of cellulose synthase and poly-beta-1,6-N-acetylglucosamine synthase [Saccharopolyspora kobensis]SFC77845.1 Glycosyltransferase, catalytic subunit of cellulose synthase and poly-beta-1,6-N-acetylglucosamine synthase [Saccharopolyspora kobensis]